MSIERPVMNPLAPTPPELLSTGTRVRHQINWINLSTAFGMAVA